MNYTIYSALTGQRWDSVAYANYGNAFLYQGLIEANPLHANKLTLEGGEQLIVPTIEKPISSAGLPPWRR